MRWPQRPKEAAEEAGRCLAFRPIEARRQSSSPSPEIAGAAERLGASVYPSVDASARARALSPCPGLSDSISHVFRVEIPLIRLECVAHALGRARLRAPASPRPAHGPMTGACLTFRDTRRAAAALAAVAPNPNPNPDPNPDPNPNPRRSWWSSRARAEPRAGCSVAAVPTGCLRRGTD